MSWIKLSLVWCVNLFVLGVRMVDAQIWLTTGTPSSGTVSYYHLVGFRSNLSPPSAAAFRMGEVLCDIPKKRLRGRLSLYGNLRAIYRNHNLNKRNEYKNFYFTSVFRSFCLIHWLSMYFEMWKLSGIALKPKAGSMHTLQEKKGLCRSYL